MKLLIILLLLSVNGLSQKLGIKKLKAAQATGDSAKIEMSNTFLMKTDGMRYVSPFDEQQDMRVGQFDYYKPEPKTDTVKGWIRFYQLAPLKEQNPKESELIIWDEEYKTGAMPLILITKKAIAIYDGDKNVSQLTLRTFTDGKPHPYDPEHGYLLKIICGDVKEFDLSKKYEFIKDDEIIK